MTIMIGIDPHKATHTAVAIDDNETVLDQFTLRASSVQARRLCDWACQFDDKLWAVESARGLGYLVAQQLVAAGETVFDVPPLLASRVRVLGVRAFTKERSERRLSCRDRSAAFRPVDPGRPR